MALIRLDALPAPDVWHALNTLTQHAVGPRSTVTVGLDAAALRRGDVAGLALFSQPYGWIGVEREKRGFRLIQFDEYTGQTSGVPLSVPRVWLRADCDFVRRTSAFRFSTDGASYVHIGQPCIMANGSLASQSLACSLFACSTQGGARGGHADFDWFLLTTEVVRPFDGQV